LPEIEVSGVDADENLENNSEIRQTNAPGGLHCLVFYLIIISLHEYASLTPCTIYVTHVEVSWPLHGKLSAHTL